MNLQSQGSEKLSGTPHCTSSDLSLIVSYTSKVKIHMLVPLSTSVLQSFLFSFHFYLANLWQSLLVTIPTHPQITFPFTLRKPLTYKSPLPFRYAEILKYKDVPKTHTHTHTRANSQNTSWDANSATLHAPGFYQQLKIMFKVDSPKKKHSPPIYTYILIWAQLLD